MNKPVNDDDYKSFADTELDGANMEAVAANAEQDVDMNQAIRHNLYIGWALGLAKAQGKTFQFMGGNRVLLESFPVPVVIPYPPTEWEP